MPTIPRLPRPAFLPLVLLIGGAAFTQTYTHPTLGVQSTYAGACVVSTCSGTYYDNGGAGGNYAANVNNIYRTFCPSVAGQCLRATFSSFSMNDTYFLCFGPNSCCDHLQILNGPAQNSPALYNNCTTSPGTITASNPSGCLTFRFVSDGSVNLAGWAATLSCVPCAGGPSGTSNSDCAFASPICADTPIADVSVGPGITAEGCSGCNTSEVYTNWYRIQIQTSGTLAFTINPNVNSDDFDPVVYGPNVTCGALGTPIRCSYAINAGNGNTGLGNGAVDFSETVAGDQWVAPIAVTAGQTYYVLINGWSATSGTNGFLLDWTGTASLNCTFLPVDLMYLRAECAEGLPLVTWATASEQDNAHFVVQRSTDRTTWKDVGTLQAAGNAGQATEYLFVDPTPVDADVLYYRLHQVDHSGEATLTQMVTLDRCRSGSTAVSAAPNPVTDILTVRVEELGPNDVDAVLEVVDGAGRSVLSRTALLPMGSGQLDLDLRTLASGTYTLIIRNSNTGEARQVRVVKYDE